RAVDYLLHGGTDSQERRRHVEGTNRTWGISSEERKDCRTSCAKGRDVSGGLGERQIERKRQREYGAGRCGLGLLRDGWRQRSSFVRSPDGIEKRGWSSRRGDGGFQDLVHQIDVGEGDIGVVAVESEILDVGSPQKQGIAGIRYASATGREPRQILQQVD